MAFRNIFIGLGPAVYLLMISGRIICIGTIGTANNARVSFGIPASMSFRPERESAAAKAICGKIEKSVFEGYYHLQNDIPVQRRLTFLSQYFGLLWYELRHDLSLGFATS